MSAAEIRFEVENQEGELVELVLPATWVVCSRCSGKGTHVNPAVDGNGLTQEDFDEAGPEFRDDYMAGVYDVPCYECNGARSILVPDRAKLTKEERVAWYEQVRELADMAAEEEAERRMGA